MSQEREEDLLKHSTMFNSLYNILNTSELVSRTELNRRSILPLSHEVHNDSIFFSPIFFSRFIKAKDNSPSIFLDFEKTLQIYPEYYINEGNSFEPLDGKKNRYKTCECMDTYHHNLNYNNFFNLLLNIDISP